MYIVSFTTLNLEYEIMKIKLFICAMLIIVTPPSMAASVYIADLDSSQSSFFVNFDDTSKFQLSGSLKIKIDSGTIQFEDIDISSAPSFSTSDMILSDVGSYDGFNFQYVLCDTCLGNAYEGTFDGSSLLLQGITFGTSAFNYSIASSSITAVPLPNSFILILTSLAGLSMRLRKKKQNKSFNLTGTENTSLS